MTYARNFKTILWRFKYQTLLLLLAVGIIATAYTLNTRAETRYQALLSTILTDRHNSPIQVKANSKGHYVYPTLQPTPEFTALLIAKEDRFFYYHPGVNPFSIAKALLSRLTRGKVAGGSTITEQLAKNLLQTEQDRTLTNKLRELAYALSLELFTTKDEILMMYLNVAYLGNQIQGFETASAAYFNKTLRETSLSEQLALLATLSYPNSRNPWKNTDLTYARALSEQLLPKAIFTQPIVTKEFSFQKTLAFELTTAGVECLTTCATTLDNALSETIRGIVNRHLERSVESGARSSAVVVIDPKTSELIALIGSKDPESTEAGNQINMALEPRPIGSTVKPFIYLKGFMDGLRPYTEVEDREYKYPIATGFSIYPKNYDGTYHGIVTLHTALSNSLNVPSVKVLEYIGLGDFYSFLSQDLKFKPLRDLDTYQYGIALGGLEMDLLTLTHYFTIFPREGTIAPLKVLRSDKENFSLPPQSSITKTLTVAETKYTKLVHAILNDRLSGVNQFGLESNLNIETTGYGVKTGTSRDFHDSWVVGYTPDFVVGVWLGNTENKPMQQITGQSGAGAIWNDVMNVLLASPYRTKESLSLANLQQFPIEKSLEWGLPDDTVAIKQKLLLTDALILGPHHGDSFEWFTGMSVPLSARSTVSWYSNGLPLGTGTELDFIPEGAGTYEIMARQENEERREIITVLVTTPP